jgi:ABC-type transport system substrate-binding protein
LSAMPFPVRIFPLTLAVLLAACAPDRDPGNVYRGALLSNLKTLDPAHASDSYSIQAQFQVYETLYEYKYLARPYDIQPCLAAAMPEVSPGGMTHTIRMRAGVEFADDKSFPGGIGRRVTAHDFVYSIKRLADVRTQTYGWWVFDGKIRGLNEFRAASEKLPPLPDSAYPALYDTEIAGLRALDDSTVRIVLTHPYPYFKYLLAMPYAAVVAREAVEYYGEEFLNNPVGTGPYVLKEWRRGLRLAFARNPKYHHGFYPTEGSAGDSAAGLLADAGKPLPFVDRAEIYIYNETQPMWLNFLRGRLDRGAIPKDNYAQAVTPERGLRGEFAELLPDCGAAFSIEVAGEERLVIVQEVDRRKRADWDHVVEANLNKSLVILLHRSIETRMTASICVVRNSLTST